MEITMPTPGAIVGAFVLIGICAAIATVIASLAFTGEKSKTAARAGPGLSRNDNDLSINAGPGIETNAQGVLVPRLGPGLALNDDEYMQVEIGPGLYISTEGNVEANVRGGIDIGPGGQIVMGDIPAGTVLGNVTGAAGRPLPVGQFSNQSLWMTDASGNLAELKADGVHKYLRTSLSGQLEWEAGTIKPVYSLPATTMQFPLGVYANATLSNVRISAYYGHLPTTGLVQVQVTVFLHFIGATDSNGGFEINLASIFPSGTRFSSQGSLVVSAVRRQTDPLVQHGFQNLTGISNPVGHASIQVSILSTGSPTVTTTYNDQISIVGFMTRTF